MGGPGGGQRCEKTVSFQVAAKFQLLLEVSEDIEISWLLFRTTMILSAVESCRQKRLRMAAGSEKETPWWNQDVKEAIRAKDMHLRPCCKTGDHLICNPGVLRRKKLHLWL